MSGNRDDLTCCKLLTTGCGTFVLPPAFGAGIGAVSGWAGSSIMNNDHMREATQMGAVGGALVFLLFHYIDLCMNSDKESEKQDFFNALIKGVAKIELSGLLGFLILNAVEECSMNIGQTAASFGVGGAVTSVSLSVVVSCLGFCCVGAMAGLKASNNNKLRENLIKSKEDMEKSSIRNIEEGPHSESQVAALPVFSPVPGR